MFPHRSEFPYRRQVFWGTTAVCATIAIVSPGLSLPMRIAAPAIALFSAAAGYAVGWMPSKLQARLWSQVAPGLIGFFCLAFFYGFLIAVPANLLLYPFVAADLQAEGVTFGQLVMMLPAGVGAAAGAHRVFSDHIVVV